MKKLFKSWLIKVLKFILSLMTEEELRKAIVDVRSEFDKRVKARGWVMAVDMKPNSPKIPWRTDGYFGEYWKITQAEIDRKMVAGENLWKGMWGK